MSQRRPAVVLAVLCAAAVAGAVVLAAQRGSTGAPPWIAIAVVGGLVVALLLVVTVTKARRGRGDRGGPTDAAAAAEALGLDYRPKTESKHHARFGPLPGIPTRGEVRHLMTGRWEGRALTIFQHTYHVHTGQAPIPVYHTVYVTDAPAWPFLTVTRRTVLGRLLRRLGRRRGLQLEEEAFNTRRRVVTDDEDFAVMLLAPEMQAFLVDKPEVAWSIHPGRVAMIYNGALRPDRIDASLERLRTFWSLVPPELDAWENADA